MLISPLKLIVDVDYKGKKVVINILMDPPMYPPKRLPCILGTPSWPKTIKTKCIRDKSQNSKVKLYTKGNLGKLINK